jgi:hypothetical protein
MALRAHNAEFLTVCPQWQAGKCSPDMGLAESSKSGVGYSHSMADSIRCTVHLSGLGQVEAITPNWIDLNT